MGNIPVAERKWFEKSITEYVPFSIKNIKTMDLKYKNNIQRSQASQIKK